jgi:hypothetical protein
MWALVALVFALAALGKLVQGGFVDYLTTTEMFPWPLPPFVAAGVIACELLTCALLLWPAGRRAGWVLTGGLGSAFAVFHVAAAALEDVEACRCMAVQFVSDVFLNHVLTAALCLAMVSAAFLSLCGRKPPAPKGLKQTP